VSPRTRLREVRPHPFEGCSRSHLATTSSPRSRPSHSDYARDHAPGAREIAEAYFKPDVFLLARLVAGCRIYPRRESSNVRARHDPALTGATLIDGPRGSRPVRGGGHRRYRITASVPRAPRVTWPAADSSTPPRGRTVQFPLRSDSHDHPPPPTATTPRRRASAWREPASPGPPPQPAPACACSRDAPRWALHHHRARRGGLDSGFTLAVDAGADPVAAPGGWALQIISPTAASATGYPVGPRPASAPTTRCCCRPAVPTGRTRWRTLPHDGAGPAPT